MELSKIREVFAFQDRLNQVEDSALRGDYGVSPTRLNASLLRRESALRIRWRAVALSLALLLVLSQALSRIGVW